MSYIIKIFLIICLGSTNFLFADKVDGNFYMYTIKKGNTLGDILLIFKTTEQELQKYNASSILKNFMTNTVIKIPINNILLKRYKIQKGDSLYSIAKNHNIPPVYLQQTIDGKIQTNMWINTLIYIPLTKNNIPLAQHKYTPKKNVEKIPIKNNTYTVQKGDTYYGLARKFNINVKELQDANKNTPLQSGKKIILPSLSNNLISTPKTPPVKPDIVEQLSSSSESLLDETVIFKGKLSPPYKGKIEKYSPLVPGVTYNIIKTAGRKITSPIKGIVTDIKPIIGFGMGIFIKNGDTTVIIASKGFSSFIVKTDTHINTNNHIANASFGYKLYLFMLKDDKVLPPF